MELSQNSILLSFLFEKGMTDRVLVKVTALTVGPALWQKLYRDCFLEIKTTGYRMQKVKILLHPAKFSQINCLTNVSFNFLRQVVQKGPFSISELLHISGVASISQWEI